MIVICVSTDTAAADIYVIFLYLQFQINNEKKNSSYIRVHFLKKSLKEQMNFELIG